MNTYQNKWLDTLTQINLPGWKFAALGDDILITVPDNKSIKELSDNIETVVAELSLDINLPKERLKFVIRNSREEVDYLLNPNESDLNTEETA